MSIGWLQLIEHYYSLNDTTKTILYILSVIVCLIMLVSYLKWKFERYARIKKCGG